MKITYTGKHEELSPQQMEKFEAKLQKIAKMLERSGEKEAHVILKNERFLHCVEITVNALDHALVGAGSNGELLTSMNEAAEKLEKQVVRLRDKWRDTHRHQAPRDADLTGQSPTAPEHDAKQTEKSAARPKIFRVNHSDGSKPMTLEQALMEIDDQDYLVYRDMDKDCVSVLMRRSDGNFDLIES